MTRPRVFPLLGLLAGLLVAVGCSKKTEPAQNADEPAAPDGKAAAELAAKKDHEAREEAKKRLERIGKALHEHEATFGFLPAGVVGPKGELGLSWRVQLLPYLGEDALFKQFKLNEPWDSPTNKPLVAKMPEVFASPGKAAPAGQTYLRSFSGESGFLLTPPGPPAPKGAKAPPPYPHLQPGRFAPGQRFGGISDGTSNTLAVAEAAEPVEWTKPDDLPFRGFVVGPNPPAVPKLGGPFPDGFHGLLIDGRVFFFPAGLKDEELRAIISVNGGEVQGMPVIGRLAKAAEPPKKVPPTSVPDALPDAAARRTAVANLQAVVKAAHAYHDANGHLPAGVAAKDAVGLSWRVQILPFIGEEALYKQLKLDEPWDSEHNKPLVGRMPKVFASMGKPAPAGYTFLRTTIGPQGMIQTFPGQKGLPPGTQPGQPARGRKLTDILDGTANTILVVEAGEAVPWTKPEELPFAGVGQPVIGKGGVPGPPKDVKVPPLGGVFGDGFHAAMADGRVTFYKSGYPAFELAKLLCPNDGWVVEPLGDPDKILYSIPAPAAQLPGPPPDRGH